MSSPGNRGSPIICGVNTGQHSNVNHCSRTFVAKDNKKYFIIASDIEIKALLPVYAYVFRIVLRFPSTYVGSFMSMETNIIT